MSSTLQCGSSRRRVYSERMRLDVPLFAQKEFGCGPACLRMVLASQGITVSDVELWRKARTRRGVNGGTKREDMLRVLRLYGFEASYRAHLSLADIRKHIRKENIAPIVFWFFEENHYSLIVDVGKNTVTLADPDEGGVLRTFSHNSFIEKWFEFPGSVPKKSTLQIRPAILISAQSKT